MGQRSAVSDVVAYTLQFEEESAGDPDWSGNLHIRQVLYRPAKRQGVRESRVTRNELSQLHCPLIEDAIFLKEPFDTFVFVTELDIQLTYNFPIQVEKKVA